MTHSESALMYAERVCNGDIPACQLIKLACGRFIDDLGKKDWAFTYDQAKADHVVGFIETLPHTKGRWASKKELLILEPWQKFIVCNIFGWIDKKGFRRFREVYAEIPRKNGKSMLAAGIGLYMFVVDGEYGSEIYSGATTEKQAWEVFRPARDMVRKKIALKNKFDIEVNAKTLSVLSTGSRFEPIVGNPGDGSSPSCAIVDEYHEHSDDRLYDTMQTGMGAREHPLMFAITTAGSNLGGPCYEKRHDAISVLENPETDEALFTVIYTIDEGDEWSEPETLVKANPNYGISVSGEFLERAQDSARRSASKQSAFRTKHLNEWVGASTVWMNMLAWQRQKKAMVIEDFAGQTCHVAIDLAEQKDCSSIAVMFKKNGKYSVFCKHFVPEAAFEWNDKYKTFALGGHIETTPGNAQDYGAIKEYVEWLASNFTVKSVHFDPWQANQMMQELMDTGLEVYKFTQQFSSYSDPMKTVETAVLDGDLYHSGDPVLTWMVGNVAALRSRDDHIKPIKENPNNPRCKIDGAAAMIMAMKAYTFEEDKGSLDSWLSNPVVTA